MKVLPNRAAGIQAVARLIQKNKARYQAVCTNLGISSDWWTLIGCIHYREGSCNFHTHLANGDPLTHKTVHVPAGGPPGNPPFTWEYAAEWALKREGAHNLGKFTPEEFAYFAEGYNGWGYAARGQSSAYLWAGTTIHEAGKFIADHVYSPSAVDEQQGVMGILQALLASTGAATATTSATTTISATSDPWWIKALRRMGWIK